jgi:hypothetical protein
VEVFLPTSTRGYRRKWSIFKSRTSGHGCVLGIVKQVNMSTHMAMSIGVAAWSKARTVFARSIESHWGMDVCVCSVCVFFCFYIVSSEAANRPNKRLMRTYHWISLFMSYIRVSRTVSKLAYRIWVILIANKRVKKTWQCTNCIAPSRSLTVTCSRIRRQLPIWRLSGTNKRQKRSTTCRTYISAV